MPCIIVRNETEREEIIESGSGILSGQVKNKIIESYQKLASKELNFPKIFGDGSAVKFICKKIIQNQSAASKV